MTTAKGTEAGKELRRGVLGALNNVWRRSCPKDPVPWAKQITIPGEDANRARRERAASGERRFDRGSGFTVRELRWILIAALALDLVGRRTSRKRRGVNNHADLTAFLMHHTVRVGEPTFLRRKDFKLDLGAVLVSGTKTTASEERLIPTQRAYEPWRDRLLSGGADPEDFLLPSSDRHTQPTAGNYQDKLRRVLVAAGLKRDGDLTKVFRASHISIAVGTLTAEQIAAISGHQIPGDEQLSDHYLLWRSFIAGLPEKAFTYFPDLGTPEALEDEARRALREGRIDLEAVAIDQRRRRGGS